MHYYKLRIIIYISVFTLLFIFSMSPANTQVEADKVYVTGLDGNVEVGRIDKDDTIKISIGEGWFIKTGKSSSAILIVNDLVVKVNENTRLEIVKADEKTVKFNLKYGFIKVDSRQVYENKDIVINTENDSVKVESNQALFELSFNNDVKELEYEVEEGEISINTDEVKIYVDKNGIKNKENNNTYIDEKVDDDERVDDDYNDIDININDDSIFNENTDKEQINDDYIEKIIPVENEDDKHEDENDITINDDKPIVEVEEDFDSINDVIDEETLEDLEDIGTEINEGIEPPNIEGKYLVDNMYLIYDSRYFPHYFDPGYNMKNYVYTFYEQTEDNKIKVKYHVLNDSNVKGGGEGAFISGEDNSFTIYLRTKSSLGGVMFDTLQIISGTVNRDGIDNFQLTLIIMGKIGADVENIEMEDFPPIGTKRIIIAKDRADRLE